MKTITLDKYSRWVRFATSWGKWKYTTNPDICSFRRALIWGSIKLLVLVAIGALLYGMLVGAGASLPEIANSKHKWLYAALFPIALFGLSALVGVIFVGAAISIDRAIGWIKANHTPEPVQAVVSPIREAYTSWKDKYCARVIVK